MVDINKLNYNPVVYLIEDEAERSRCQFVYPPGNYYPGGQCKRDGKYRIGETIFLCGYHMPGVGRRLGRHKPVIIKSMLA